MRILELHTIALTIGLFIAACNNIFPKADEASGAAAETRLEANANTNPGVLAEYFDNINFTGTRVARLEPNVNFNWLTVGTKLVLNDFTDHAARTSSGTQNLVAGQRLPIKLEYYENAWDASLKFEWSGPNVPRAVIPKSQLLRPQSRSLR